jgi:Zn-finger nucleic acid-binding protein
MERITYEGVGALRCPGCGGYLVHKRRLKAIQRRRQFPNEALQRSLEHTTALETDSNLQCPECLNVMNKNMHGFGVRLQLDVCPHCDAVWLDAGELERAQMEFEKSAGGRDIQRMQRTWEQMSPKRRREFEANCERLPDTPQDAEPGVLTVLFHSFLHEVIFGRPRRSLFDLFDEDW